jgi:group I intron endonuclease
MTSPCFGRIYLITNTVNGKYYVGQTKATLKSRWTAHTSGKRIGCRYLKSAINKYGKSAFVIEELVTADSRSELNQLETLWILASRSYDRNTGYNLTFGGDAGEPTERTRLKMSESAKKRFEDPEERRKTSEIVKKRFDDVDERLRQSEMMKKRFEDPTERSKQSERMLRKFEDPAERQKISDFHRGRKLSLHTKQAIGKSNLGLKRSPEIKEKMCLAAQKRCIEHRNDGTLLRAPETREKMRISQKTRRTREKEIKLLESQIAQMDWERLVNENEEAEVD